MTNIYTYDKPVSVESYKITENTKWANFVKNKLEELNSRLKNYEVFVTREHMRTLLVFISKEKQGDKYIEISYTLSDYIVTYMSSDQILEETDALLKCRFPELSVT